MEREEKFRREAEEAKQSPENVVQLPGSFPVGDEPDDIEGLIASFTEPDDAWKVSVYRLDEPGRLDSAARREFCATLPVTEDLQERIRDTWGGGDYSLEFKQKGRIKKKGNVSIADLPDVEDEEDEPGYMPPAAERDDEAARRLDRIEAALEALAARDAARDTPQPAQSAQPNPLSALRESMKTLRELQELDADLRPPANQKPSASGLSDEERAWVALLKDGELRSQISSSIASVIGSGDAVVEEPWYARALLVIAQQPALSSRALGLIEKLLPGGAAAAQSAQSSAVPRQTEPTQPARASAARTAEAGNVTRNKQQDVADVIGNIVGDLKSNADVSDSVADCLAMMEDPESGAMLAGLLQQSAADVLQTLKQYFPAIAPMIDVPHAEEWVDELKAEIERRLGQQAAANAIRAAMNKGVDG